MDLSSQMRRSVWLSPLSSTFVLAKAASTRRGLSSRPAGRVHRSSTASLPLTAPRLVTVTTTSVLPSVWYRLSGRISKSV